MNGNESRSDEKKDEITSPSSSSLNSIIKNSKISGIFILDEKGTILKINPGVTIRFGYSEKDVCGQNFELLFTTDDRLKGKPHNEISTVKKTGSAMDNNYIVHKNGKHIWVNGESILAKDENDQIFIIKVVYDLSMQHDLEKSLFKVNNDLTTFVYTASHDLKAPINNMEGLLDSLQNILNNGEDYEEVLGMMKESINKFKGVLKDLSTVGKKQEEEIVQDISPIQFNEMTNNVIYYMDDLIERTHASIKWDFSQAASINYSRKNLRSIIHNLLSNALKYRSLDRKPEIFLSTEKTNEFIKFKIRDNGMGIKESDVKKLFSMYQRFHKEIEGTGVGLAIIKRIIENNEGKIEVESKEGEGTTFTVYFKQ